MDSHFKFNVVFKWKLGISDEIDSPLLCVIFGTSGNSEKQVFWLGDTDKVCNKRKFKGAYEKREWNTKETKLKRASLGKERR